MPIPTTDMQRRLVRWQLAHTAPTHLSIDHPVQADLAAAADEIADYEAVLAEHRQLVRRLDVALNGEAGAAKQASLCDIIGQVEDARVTPAMIEAGMEQWRLDSSCLLNGRQRIERMLRAALTGGTDRALFNEEIKGL